MAGWERQAETLERQAGAVEQQHPQLAKVRQERAAEQAAAQRLADLEERLAVRRFGRLRGPERTQVEAEVNRLRQAHPGLYRPPEERDRRWDGFEADAGRRDAREVERLRSEASTARDSAEPAWRGLHQQTPERELHRSRQASVHEPSLHQRAVHQRQPEIEPPEMGLSL